MITIKLKYKSSTPYFQKFLGKLRQQFSCVYRYSYNRLYDGLSKIDIYHQISELNNVEMVNSRLINDCIDFAARIYEKDKKDNHKSIFGGRKNFIQLIKGKLTKSEYSKKRLNSLYIQGETTRNGNRYFTLDIENNKIIFKYNRDNHYKLNINSTSKHDLKLLKELQDLCLNNKAKFTITMDEQQIHISFEEIKHKINLKSNRYVGIDLNPSCIGISVCDSANHTIINAYNFDFTEIISKIENIKKPSTSEKIIQKKYLNNKLNYEILDISKRISEISKHYQCKFIFIEDLYFKPKKEEKNKGKKFNRLTKNLWKRNIFIRNLEKKSVMNGQNMYKVNSVYSSLIGNCMYDYVDPINSSIEIGRRGYECIINKSKKFYPTVCLKQSLTHHWKEKIKDITGGWKKLFDDVKNMKLSYRVSLEDVKLSFDVFRKKVRMYNIYQFN